MLETIQNAHTAVEEGFIKTHENQEKLQKHQKQTLADVKSINEQTEALRYRNYKSKQQKKAFKVQIFACN